MPNGFFVAGALSIGCAALSRAMGLSLSEELLYAAIPPAAVLITKVATAAIGRLIQRAPATAVQVVTAPQEEAPAVRALPATASESPIALVAASKQEPVVPAVTEATPPVPVVAVTPEPVVAATPTPPAASGAGGPTPPATSPLLGLPDVTEFVGPTGMSPESRQFWTLAKTASYLSGLPAVKQPPLPSTITPFSSAFESPTAVAVPLVGIGPDKVESALAYSKDKKQYTHSFRFHRVDSDQATSLNALVGLIQVEEASELPLAKIVADRFQLKFQEWMSRFEATVSPDVQADESFSTHKVIQALRAAAAGTAASLPDSGHSLLGHIQAVFVYTSSKAAIVATFGKTVTAHLVPKDKAATLIGRGAHALDTACPLAPIRCFAVEPGDRIVLGSERFASPDLKDGKLITNAQIGEALRGKSVREAAQALANGMEAAQREARLPGFRKPAGAVVVEIGPVSR